MVPPKSPLDFVDFCQQYQLKSTDAESLRLYQTYLDNLSLFYQVMENLIPSPTFDVVSDLATQAKQKTAQDKD